MIAPRRDVLVVGAGPAGATAARELALRGWNVLLLDRFTFPRDKACGDALIPDAIAALGRAGLLERVRAHAWATSAGRLYSPRRVEAPFTSDFLTLERKRLDHMLVEAAMEAGAELRQARVTALACDGDSVRARTAAGEELRAAWGVVATGADVSLLRDPGAVEREEPSCVAIRRYVRSTAVLEELVFSFDRAVLPGYGWIFPLGGGDYNVGLGVDLGTRRGRAVDVRAGLDQFMESFPPARRILDAAVHVGPVRGARLRTGLKGVRPRAGRRVLAIGETVGSTYPLSGEGIGKAMETAEIAAALLDDALRAGDPEVLAAYPARLEALRPRYRGYQAAARWLSVPWLADLTARRASRSPRLRRRAEALLREGEDARRVFSAGAIVRSLLG